MELFRKQWNFLAAAKVDVVDSERLAVITPICNQIAEEVLADGHQ